MIGLYHDRPLGETLTIRLNLRGVRKLLPEFEFENFDLTAEQKATLEKRFLRYQELGGIVDFAVGRDASPEHIERARIQHARPARMYRGKMLPAVPRKILPARLVVAKPALEPSLDHIPSTPVIAQVIAESKGGEA